MMRCSLGQILATPAALEAIKSAGQTPLDFLPRHSQGDWGEVCEEEEPLKDDALKDGSRLLSAYSTSNGTKLALGDHGGR